MAELIYIIASFIEILLLLGFTIYVFFLIYSYFKGSFYVPTENREIEKILQEIHLKKNQLFYDLGCGDGRIAIMAAKKYQVNAFGIDVNPLLIKIAQFKAVLQRPANIHFKVADILKTDFHDAEVIYIFLMPNFIKKIVPVFRQQLKKKTQIISHGFKIDGFEKYLEKTIVGKNFSTYYYQYQPNI